MLIIPILVNCWVYHLNTIDYNRCICWQHINNKIQQKLWASAQYDMMNTALVGCHDAKDGEEITSSGEITTVRKTLENHHFEWLKHGKTHHKTHHKGSILHGSPMVQPMLKPSFRSKKKPPRPPSRDHRPTPSNAVPPPASTRRRSSPRSGVRRRGPDPRGFPEMGMDFL